MATLLVMGATRGIGKATVDEALDRGHRVRAFARSAGRLDAGRDGLEPWPGDALREDEVRAALAGVDAVVQALGVDHGPGMILGRTSLFSEATGHLVRAMEAQGVRRLVAVTGFGAGESRAHLGLAVRIPFELVLGRVYDDKTVQEQIIRDSGLDWTIARPGRLTDGPRSGHYHSVADPDQWRYGSISRRDVAKFLVDQIEAPTALHEAPVLTS